MPNDALIPSEQQIFAWIEQIFAQGVRRPGFPADEWAERFCLDRFGELGLERGRLEPVELPYWDTREARLEVLPANGPSFEVTCFALPHTAAAEGLELPLVEYDRADPSRVKGAASLYDVPLLNTPHAFFRALATSTYDPDGGFATSSHLVPFGREIQQVMEPSVEAGASAFIGTLTDYPGDSHDYYVPYDGVDRPLPGVWISGSDGALLRQMLATGPVRVRLTVDRIRHDIESHNVVGELPGTDEEIVIIGSHHDGPWSSAVEDASGVAMVLAQASYWSRVPREQRPHRLVFLVNAGHMCAGAGARAFVASHGEELARTVLEVHLEHTATEHAAGADGGVVSTGLPETRWWFTSRIPRLERTVADAIEAEDLRRSFVLPPTALGPRPTTDGSEFYVAGVPIVNYLTAPFYLFDSMDTLDKIHRPSLVPVTRAAVRIIESTAGVSAAAMREGAVA
jgi:hypothetical protein